jgi:hypothetical protein
MDLKKVAKIIPNYLKNNIPFMLHGAPGIGKSDLMKGVAQEHFGGSLVDVRLAQIEPTELRGLPVFQDERVSWQIPDFLPTEGKGILFLDEIDKAPTTVKNAALQLVLDRKLGSYTLPDGWKVACAGNRERDNCFSIRLGAALANRLCHITVDHDLDTWSEWARKNDVSPDIIGFLNFRPELLYHNNSEESDAFPTPRSWAMASRLIDDLDLSEARPFLVSAVGEGTAQQFMVWSKVYRNVDPVKILKSKKPFDKNAEQSFIFAIVMAIAFYARKDNNLKKNLDKIVNFCNYISPEMKVLFIRQQDNKSISILGGHPKFHGTIDSLIDVIGA